MTAAEPSHATRLDPALELDAFVAAFEVAAASGPYTDLALFLPPESHPLRKAVLRELVRVDLELAWSHGLRKFIEDYKGRFPELFNEPNDIRDLIGEEYRLRIAAGERPNSREYQDRFGPDVGSLRGDSCITRNEHKPGYEQATDRMPDIGDTIAPGYRLTNELGRGAFGRVFLAHETNLGDRPVVIKLSAQLADEPLTLARLQHTNIVPVFSAHRVGPYTALVMPFLGSTTLGDVIASFRAGRAPQSGHGLVSTLADRARTTKVSLAGANPEPMSVSSSGLSRASLEALDRMTFIEAILWIGEELADGLAHAHDRGVLHRDIKPANVLFTEDGRPMLLDFNLASIGTQRVAGTPAYMAPEQLAAAIKERGLATPQSDIYALGLVLVELLAGRLPFEEPHGRWEDSLPVMLAEKERPVLDTLPLPTDATPGVRSVLTKCLDPDPLVRYRSAADLREDLNRQRCNQPLKYAREWSLRERLRKWVRRHPRLSSGGSIAVVAVVVVGLLMAAYFGLRWQLGLREAELARAGLSEARDFAQSGLPLSPTGEWQAIRQAALAALKPYEVESDDWFNGPLVTRRPDHEWPELRRDAAELMYWTAEASARISQMEPAAEPSLLKEALEWNRRARHAFPGTIPRPFLLQRAALLRKSGRASEADGILNEVMRAPEPDPEDRAARGFAALEAGKYGLAAANLRTAAQSGPPRYSTWMALGEAERRQERYASACDAFSAGSALRPSSSWPYFHRGVTRMESRDYALARADFDRFLELNPTDADGYLNRGIVRLLSGDPRGAAADCDKAEQNHCTRTRIYAVREKARRSLGDSGGADRDLKTFLSARPSDAKSWCARGERKLALSPRDLAGALADFDEALALDANNLDALRDKASVLAEDPHQQGEAVLVLDQVLKQVPHSLTDRAGRTVLLARVGRSSESLGEIAAIAKLADDGLLLYQLASASLIAGDKSRGLDLLRSALRKDPSFVAQMQNDPDLKSIWKEPDFLNLCAAANTLKAK